MDGERFDRMTRAMVRGTSRRRVLGGIAAGLAGVAGISRVRPASAECNLGACHSNADCTCVGVETCGNNGECCRTTIGIYCNPTETGSACCSPRYVCTPGTTFQNAGTDSFGCQCNTAEGFVLTDGACCIPNGSTGNANHPDLCCSGCVVGGQCADASHCQQPQCVAAGGTCNACHQCCEGSTCTDPNHACDGSGGTCCLNNGEQGNANHPDLCCSGCLCPDGNCCDATHCQPQCQDGQVPCGPHCIDPTTQCCADEEIGILCSDATQGTSGFKPKCCPQGHQCHQHPRSKTFDCRIAKSDNSARHGNKKHRR